MGFTKLLDIASVVVKAVGGGTVTKRGTATGIFVDV